MLVLKTTQQVALGIFIFTRYPSEDILQLNVRCTVCIRYTFMQLGQWSTSLYFCGLEFIQLLLSSSDEQQH